MNAPAIVNALRSAPLRVLAVITVLGTTWLSIPSVAGQVARAEALEQWIRRGYALDSPEARQIWGQLGWTGEGYGFRTLAPRKAGNAPGNGQEAQAFAQAMEFYRLKLDG